ncbi:hypothetical protein C9I99_21365 [Photobacterium lutimaris]|uniref:Tyr recombinase domain-containing protein n=1 Tax=Photobacterium lutimaris TaxID=388278 RepID=A0A2T3ITR1_9GAMM|nr:hypothetical protein C9I99_21365 [Photobacterium lutimaris]
MKANQVRAIRPSDVASAIEKAKQEHHRFEDDPVLHQAIEHLLGEFEKRKSRYAPSTIKRLNNGWGKFVQWCIDNRYRSLPASADSVEEFFHAHDHQHRNTLGVYRWAIGRMHDAVGCPNPCLDLFVTDTLAGIVRTKVINREGINQASGFRIQHLERLRELYRNSENVNELRALSIASVAYDTLLREAELVNIQFRDIAFQPDGSAKVTVPITKTNHSGIADVAEISPESVQILIAYWNSSQLQADKCNYIFAATTKYGLARKPKFDKEIDEYVYQRLSTRSIEKTFGDIWEDLGGPLVCEKKFSGHSGRVGRAQDSFKQGKSTLQIQQLGRWSSEQMVIRYCRAA